MVRIVVSRAETKDGNVRSAKATMTRKRDQANQAQNNVVARPPTTGPTP
jgi:hypothetical protein